MTHLVYLPLENCLITLSRLSTTQTDENRYSLAKPQTAQYAANTLKVISIVERLTDVPIDKIEYNNCGVKMVLKKDIIIVNSRFGKDIYGNTIGGIPFYIDKECAKYDGNFITYYPKYTGNIKSYYINGNIFSAIDYVDGVKHGKEYRWYGNGHQHLIFSFMNGVYDGETLAYLEDGYLHSKRNFIKGKLRECTIWTLLNEENKTKIEYTSYSEDGNIKSSTIDYIK